MWLHNVGERQQVIEVLLNDCLDNVQVEISVPMNREIPKPHHLLEFVAQIWLEDLLSHENAEGLTALDRNAQPLFSYQHMGKIERGFAGANDVENRCILKQVTGPEVRACRR